MAVPYLGGLIHQYPNHFDVNYKAIRDTDQFWPPNPIRALSGSSLSTPEKGLPAAAPGYNNAYNRRWDVQIDKKSQVAGKGKSRSGKSCVVHGLKYFRDVGKKWKQSLTCIDCIDLTTNATSDHEWIWAGSQGSRTLSSFLMLVFEQHNLVVQY